MRRKTISISIVLLCVLSISGVACGKVIEDKQKEYQVSKWIEQFEISPKNMTYKDEELGFYFTTKEELYGMLLCEINAEEIDKNIKLSKLEAQFYGEIDSNRIPLFSITTYNGNFDEGYLKEYYPNQTYLGNVNGFTYTLKISDGFVEGDSEVIQKQYEAILKEIEESLLNSITIEGAKEGTFSENRVNNKLNQTQIDYRKGSIEMDGDIEEITLATIHSKYGYTLEYCADYFSFKEEENREILEGKGVEEEIYPNIYFSVELVEGNRKTLLEERKRLWDKYEMSEKNTLIGKIQSYEAIKLAIKEGNTEQSMIREVYYCQIEENVVLQIELGYYNEVSEGFGMRLYNTLASLEISNK